MAAAALSATISKCGSFCDSPKSQAPPFFDSSTLRTMISLLCALFIPKSSGVTK
jgi:hypothetical protein